MVTGILTQDHKNLFIKVKPRRNITGFKPMRDHALLCYYNSGQYQQAQRRIPKEENLKVTEIQTEDI